MAGRKRIALGPKGEAIVDAAIKRGASGEAIRDELSAIGIKLSLRTVKARVSEKRGRQRVERIDKKKDSKLLAIQGRQREPSVIDVGLIDGKPPATLEEDLISLRAQRRQAEIDENWPHYMALGRLILATSEALRKATPKKNEQEEKATQAMRAMAAGARKKLHKMADQEHEESALR